MTQASSKSDRLSYETVKQIFDSYQIDRAAVRHILGISESTQFQLHLLKTA